MFLLWYRSLDCWRKRYEKFSIPKRKKVEWWENYIFVPLSKLTLIIYQLDSRTNILMNESVDLLFWPSYLLNTPICLDAFRTILGPIFCKIKINLLYKKYKFPWAFLFYFVGGRENFQTHLNENWWISTKKFTYDH